MRVIARVLMVAEEYAVLGRLITRYPRSILLSAGLMLVLLTAIAAGALSALSLNRFENLSAESAVARTPLAEQFHTGSPNVAVMLSVTEGDIRADRVTQLGHSLTERLASYPGVGDAWSYWSPGAPDTLASTDLRHGLVLAWVPGDADQVRREVLPEIERDIISPAQTAGIDIQLGGGDEVFRIAAQQATADFTRAELLVLPLVFLLLWAVYRRWILAAVTLGCGIFSVIGALALLRLLTPFTEVSTFAANIVLVLGIGLGVDYGLFLIYRFREELAAGRDTVRATQVAVAAAGRTIVFSAVTVAASLSVLLVFPFPFLASFAYAGIAVAVMAVGVSVLVLPAALLLLGHRVRRPAATGSPGRWYRLANQVMRRPVLWGGAALVLLLAMGAPAVSANFGPPDDRVLPASQPVRAMYDTIRGEFRTEEADAVQVVSKTPVPAARTVAYAERLSEVPGVWRVDSAAGSYRLGERVGEPPQTQTFSTSEATWWKVVPTGSRLAADPAGLVAEIRATPAPGDVVVGGYPADLADYRDGIVERLPLVLALIMLVTGVVLFLMTGSVLAPVKAVLLNLLSMSVMFGVLVWGFQRGGLADLLGFTPTGSIEPSIPILMFCIAYGLSMDYEVFLLSRIKQDYDRTGDGVGAIARGVQQSAPLVTAAALILAASFAVYATGEVVFLQQIGIGMAVTVLVDATLIRGVLLPAVMRLTVRANWWAPAALRWIPRRIGLHEPEVWRESEQEAVGAAPATVSRAGA